VSTVPAPASTSEALRMLSTAMGYLAAADPAAMTAQTQAECLLALEQLDAVETAARAQILAAFTAGHGYAADADYSPTSWLIHRTCITAEGAVVIDASPYFGHPEIDLAQVDFFDPVPTTLFDAYRESVPIDKGFADRRDLWQLPTHLAIVAVDGPIGQRHIALLADAIRRYASI
jgi:hypothetical protein